MKLTDLGCYIRDTGKQITCLTLKGESVEQLRALGLNVEQVIGPVDAMAEGLLDMGTQSKTVDLLIDNETHPLSKKVIHPNNIPEIMNALQGNEQIYFDIDDTLIYLTKWDVLKIKLIRFINKQLRKAAQCIFVNASKRVKW